jgi:cytochrome c
MAALMLAVTFAVVASAQEKKSVWSGVYTDAQADRGVAVYKAKCTFCHGDSLRGAIDGGPPLRGLEFTLRWNGIALSDMVDQIAQQMPFEKPNTLKRQEYVDILTFLFRANGIPAGTTELTTDPAALSSVEFFAEK